MEMSPDWWRGKSNGWGGNSRLPPPHTVSNNLLLKLTRSNLCRYQRFCKELCVGGKNKELPNDDTKTKKELGNMITQKG